MTKVLLTLADMMWTVPLLLIVASSANGAAGNSSKPYGGILQGSVPYSPLPPSPGYQSNATFNPMGMEHVYKITNTFLDIIQREAVMPKGKALQMANDSRVNK